MTAPWKPPLFAEGLGSSEAWNAVLALSGEAIPLEGTTTTLVFALGEKPAAEAWITELSLLPFTQPLFIHVSDFPFRALFNADIAMADLGGLPDGLRQALSEGVLASLRAMLPPALAERLQAGASGLASAFPALARDGIEWFALRLSNADGLQIDLALAADRSLVTRALPDVSSAATPLEAALAERITTPVDMTLGAITLAWAELASLEPGAVVVLAEQEPGTFAVRAGTVGYLFTDTGSGWRSSGPQPAARFHPRTTTVHSTTRREAMTDDSTPLPAQGDEAAAADEAALVDELRVTIDFDLGRSQVPLSVLAKWQPGALIDLTPPQVSEGVAVTIRANGDAVGTGDIVRVDDRLAVRITRFSLRS